MITGLLELFGMILVSGVLALLLSPVMIRFSRRINLMDQPGTARHKQHHTTVPMAGGLVILTSVGFTLIALPIAINKELLGILVGALIVAIFGFIDDLRDLKPQYKLVGQFAAAAAVILLGVQVHITQIVWIDLGITTLWLVGITNAFNFVDSMDGLAIGLAGIAAAFFMMVTIDSVQPGLTTLSAVLLGTMIGVYLYSAPPARMFLGDSGSQALGILLASMGIAYTPAQAGLPQGVTWFIPILVLGVPVFDMLLVMVSRLRRGKPIYMASTDHVFHRITRLGLHPNRSVSIMQVGAILLSLIAFQALGVGVITANLIFGSVVVVGLFILVYLEWGYVDEVDDLGPDH